jgi:hypothetical protein
MKSPLIAGSLMVLVMPFALMAQSSFDGTWKVDLNSSMPTKVNVWLLQNGTYRCTSCIPTIDVKADGQDQQVTGQLYDTISVKVINHQTVEEIEKKNSQVVSDEKFTVSPDGNTATDEFANWKVSMVRVSKGPPGSHALSGSWKPLKMESISDKGLLITYKIEGDTLSMSRPTGESYTAKLDGTDAPYQGDPDTNGVSVTRIDEHTIEETDKLNGKAFNISRMTLARDGKSMSVSSKDLQDRTTNQLTMHKE